jgi:hypothetical protein
MDFGGEHRPVDLQSADKFFAGSVDLRDGFYQFKNVALASWFTINLPGLTAREMGVDTIYDEETGCERRADPDEFVWAAFQGMPMGWTWALWVCHETLCDVMEVAARPGDTVSLDRHHAATLHGRQAVHAPYVDNATVLARNADIVDDRLARVTRELDCVASAGTSSRPPPTGWLSSAWSSTAGTGECTTSRGGPGGCTSA